jgi:hypothetical protein
MPNLDVQKNKATFEVDFVRILGVGESLVQILETT